MLNPYKFLRTHAGYTQASFCREYGFSKQTLISIEQGVYAELSSRMVTAITDACWDKGIDPQGVLIAEYGTRDLATVYEAYRQFERENVPPAIVGYVPTESTPELSPMHFFVKNTTGSVQGFAKVLKIQTSTLLRYIRGQQADMPGPLYEALYRAGYRHLDELIKAQTEWVEHV